MRSLGANARSSGGVDFRVWAPDHESVEIVFEGPAGSRPAVAMDSEPDGFFHAFSAEARAGDWYRYRLDGASDLFADPVSRFQPKGPFGPSEIVDPHAYAWSDQEWSGLRPQGNLVYELHIGTFTSEGNWESAARLLPELAEIGVTVLELMPVADFPGRFGWGYDGVNLFAPTRLYGPPDSFRRFVDKAHSLGVGVVLDVVYNHIGPEGSPLAPFSNSYLSEKWSSEWGDSFNFDGEHNQPVREFILANAVYWIKEFHLDGLRVDAADYVMDDSEEHILTAVTRSVREAAGERPILLIAENESQMATPLTSFEQGGFAMDAVWNDDFHHSALVALTGYREAYYKDYAGSPQELVSAVKWGYLYQGQWNRRQGHPRGSPALGRPFWNFINFLQNHDQVANTGLGLRLHNLGHPGAYRALTALLLLAPGTPMLFQGQEFAASTPFLYFADHNRSVKKSVREGRMEFYRQFSNLARREVQKELPDPGDESTFSACKLDWSERLSHAGVYGMHSDLLRLRREDAVFSSPDVRVDGAVLSGAAFVIRFFGPAGKDRLLILNLGPDLRLLPPAEPLLAPSAGSQWQAAWSSDELRYGGAGSLLTGVDREWVVPHHSASVLIPAPDDGAGS